MFIQESKAQKLNGLDLTTKSSPQDSTRVAKDNLDNTSGYESFVSIDENLSIQLAYSQYADLIGKGKGYIKYYEWIDDDNSVYALLEYKSEDPLCGIGLLPKRACGINEGEQFSKFTPIGSNQSHLKCREKLVL
ncbi:hypothetical protein HDU83_000802 [Entophlyctis luteolus]|nr:hypothetical protein HDU83_000802 [Entophlyctis luteolus]